MLPGQERIVWDYAGGSEASSDFLFPFSRWPNGWSCIRSWVSDLVTEFVLRGAQQSQLFTHSMKTMMMSLVTLMTMIVQLWLMRAVSKSEKRKHRQCFSSHCFVFTSSESARLFISAISVTRLSIVWALSLQYKQLN